MSSSEALTLGIRVRVEARYAPEHSLPQNGQWLFVYTITIGNESDRVVQLISRHWTIADAEGSVREVRGLGVVGEQPVIEPGDAYEYSSFCPLQTPTGTMEGTYQMVTSGGERFDIAVARFDLVAPYAVH